MEAILKVRSENGPFRSLYHFCETVEASAINRRLLESFIRAGAMDGLGGTRAQLMAAVDDATDFGHRAWKDRISGQAGLFGEAFAGVVTQAEPALPDVSDFSSKEYLSGEKEMLGFYVTGHPLDDFAEKVTELATHDTSNLENLEKGADVALCGIFSGINRRRNKEGRPWCSLVIEDRQGTIDAMVFANSLERLSEFLVEDKPVLVRGLVLPEEGAQPKISIQDVVPLEIAHVPFPTLISIRVRLSGKGNGLDQERAAAIHSLLDRKPGNTEVRLRLERPSEFSVVLDLPAKVRPDKEFKQELARICGSEALEVLSM